MGSEVLFQYDMNVIFISIYDTCSVILIGVQSTIMLRNILLFYIILFFYVTSSNRDLDISVGTPTQYKLTTTKKIEENRNRAKSFNS